MIQRYDMLGEYGECEPGMCPRKDGEYVLHHDYITDVDAKVKAARQEGFDKGFAEGESKQAIIEIQGRERFIADMKKEYPKGKKSVKDAREKERERIAEMVEKLTGYKWCAESLRTRRELANLIREYKEVP